MPPLTGRMLHFVGIGGAGMSGLAAVAHSLGAAVSGSDLAESPYLARLRELGLSPATGHDAANVPEGAEVVVSTAIAADNPELVRARETGARILHRGELLAELAALKRSIAVAGAHGKTTTAGMVAHALLAAGRDPAYLVGGELRSTAANAGWGKGEWVVVEADESDRSFLALRPDVAVVTNIELDHHATYRSDRELEAAFAEFAAPAQVLVAAADLSLAPASGRVVTFGIGRGELRAGEVELSPLGVRFEVAGVPFDMAVPGEHNVLNALAAIGALREAGLTLEEAAPALAGYAGAGRRFEPHGETPAGARVFDDYAHHPTEVRATLEAARRAAGDGRVLACFQPHLFSRTNALAREFGRALALADCAVVTEVYPAREAATDFPGVSGGLVARATADAAGGRRVYWAPTLQLARDALEREAASGDLILTLGAGDVDSLARALVDGQGPPGNATNPDT